MAIFSSWDM